MRKPTFAVIAALLVIAPAAFAAWGMPDPINERMEIIQGIYTQILAVGTLVFLFVFGWLIYNLVKFRPGGDGEPTFEDHRSSVKAEILWTVIPILIVAWVGFISYDGIQALQADPGEETEEIEIIGAQWFWTADYGNDVSLAQQSGQEGSLEGEDPFLIPANTNVTFNITSRDVQHAVWLPELGVKMDAYPGQNNYATFTAPEGEYLLQCAEFCGERHAYMRAKVNAVPQDEYDAWLDEREAEASQSGLQQSFDVNLTSDGIDPSSITGVAGVKLVFDVTNQDSRERELAIEGIDNSTGPIAPDETGTFNVTLDAGTYTLVSGNQEATLEVLEPETRSVSLTDFAISPEDTEFEVGQPYLVSVANEGGTIHNLYIGQPEESFDTEEVYYATENLDPGESETLLVIPTEDQTGTYEWWCDISGHYAQGMNGEVTVNS
jgi:cytochrome c oxidase subunit 2